MALNSEFHDIYLRMPVEATLLPELQNLSFWGRTIHEVLQDVNPALMQQMAERNELTAYIDLKQKHLQIEAARLEREWKQRNPLGIHADYFERTSWQRHCKLAVREILIDEMAKGLMGEGVES